MTTKPDFGPECPARSGRVAKRTRVEKLLRDEGSHVAAVFRVPWTSREVRHGQHLEIHQQVPKHNYIH